MRPRSTPHPTVFFKVSENLVQVLVEEAIEAGEIDVDDAEDRVEGAERELSELSEDVEPEELERKQKDIERRRRIGENFTRVARTYGEG